MTPDMSYDWEGGRKRRAKIINGMGGKNTPTMEALMLHRSKTDAGVVCGNQMLVEVG